jgi:hypothetical protein
MRVAWRSLIRGGSQATQSQQSCGRSTWRLPARLRPNHSLLDGFTTCPCQERELSLASIRSRRWKTQPLLAWTCCRRAARTPTPGSSRTRRRTAHRAAHLVRPPARPPPRCVPGYTAPPASRRSRTSRSSPGSSARGGGSDSTRSRETRSATPAPPQRSREEMRILGRRCVLTSGDVDEPVERQEHGDDAPDPGAQKYDLRKSHDDFGCRAGFVARNMSSFPWRRRTEFLSMTKRRVR